MIEDLYIHKYVRICMYVCFHHYLYCFSVNELRLIFSF